MDWIQWNNLKEFLLGAIVVGDLVSMLFFLRYWKVTGDRFFLFFAWSFALGALSRIMVAGYTLAVGHVVSFESEPLVYAVRLLSYGVILAGILDKNRVAIKRILFQRT